MIIGGDRVFDGENPQGNSSDGGSIPPTSTWLWRRPQVSGLNGSQLIRSRRVGSPRLKLSRFQMREGVLHIVDNVPRREGGYILLTHSVPGVISPGVDYLQIGVNPARFENGQSLGGASPCWRRLV